VFCGIRIFVEMGSEIPLLSGTLGRVLVSERPEDGTSIWIMRLVLAATFQALWRSGAPALLTFAYAGASDVAIRAT
jgi:hypothetical protein